jgi:hypothetical protein
LLRFNHLENDWSPTRPFFKEFKGLESRIPNFKFFKEVIMAYCASCKVLLNPSYNECPYCDSQNLEANPPDPQQGGWIDLPSIPGIADGKKVGGELEKKNIQYYIDQVGTATSVTVGSEKYDQALQIQEDVLGG